jgi:hypothetical protein
VGKKMSRRGKRILRVLSCGSSRGSVNKLFGASYILPMFKKRTVT